MKISGVFLAFFMTLSIGLSAQSSAPWLGGDWQGIGYQAPTDTHWPIELTYDQGSKMLQVNYPSLSCSGHWELVETKEGYAEFVERITTGQQNCDNNVKVVVTRIDEEYISIAYFLPDLYDGVVAYSVLRKANTQKKRIPVPDIKKTKRT
jgi:hypothetical protein